MTMDLFRLIVPVFLVCVDAGNQTVVKVDLGENATLTCPVNTSNTYWYTEIHSQVRGFTARTFSPDPNDTQYYVETTVKNKYVAMGNHLVITNITNEDYRLYFCATKQNNSLLFQDPLLLVSVVPISGPETNQHRQLGCRRLETVLYSSFVLNALLVLVIIGLVTLSLKKKNRNNQVTDPSPFTYENPETLETPQYEEIHLRDAPPAAPPPECIYYKAQLPHSTLPRHH